MITITIMTGNKKKTNETFQSSVYFEFPVQWSILLLTIVKTYVFHPYQHLKAYQKQWQP